MANRQSDAENESIDVLARPAATVNAARIAAGRSRALHERSAPASFPAAVVIVNGNLPIPSAWFS